MARLRHVGTRDELEILPVLRIGRSPSRHLVLDHALVGREHATVAWERGTWACTDQGSRNGTWRNGERLEAGQPAPLRVGDVLQFATPEQRWEVLELAPPRPVAVSGPTASWAWNDSIVLPDAEQDELTVFLSEETGGWMVQGPNGITPAHDGMTLHAGGRVWELQLPAEVQITVAPEVDHSAAEVALHFVVDNDQPGEERVALKVEAGSRTWDLGAAAPWRPLWTLAQERARGEQRVQKGALEDGQQGWMRAADVAEVNERRLNWVRVNLHRARNIFANAGVPGAERLIEKLFNGEIRIGYRRFTFRELN